MADKLHDKIQELAKVRKYWRELANGLGDATGSPVVVGLTSRIQSRADELLKDLKICDPKNDTEIAGIQFGLRELEKVLLDFDLDTCNKQIADLDTQIKAVATEIDKKAEKKKNPGVGGFNNLILRK
jgi:hypothetical protein